jgi:hypothetical protein
MLTPIVLAAAMWVLSVTDTTQEGKRGMWAGQFGQECVKSGKRRDGCKAEPITDSKSAPKTCWHPGLSRNIGIAEQSCDFFNSEPRH